jgi:hypothetical protein
MPATPTQPPSDQQFSNSPIQFPSLDASTLSIDTQPPQGPVHGIVINYVMDRTTLEKAFGSAANTTLYDKIDALADLIFESRDALAIEDAFMHIRDCANPLSTRRQELVTCALNIFRASFNAFNEWYQTLDASTQYTVAHQYYFDAD